ncbi:MAG: helix-turn-helix domain-containing protein [Pseudomonadales bacterium]|jgi:excisionase family DNA binding protein|nr:helix-turn-helix domain-containing protein [Pseudomonadales bacterium]
MYTKAVMVTPTEDQFVSSSEAAQLLGAAHVIVSKLCQSGRLPAVKIANRWLIRKDVLVEFAKM